MRGSFVADEALALESAIEAARRWLGECAWPIWLEHGVDREAGAFHENLDHEKRTCAADFRRLRVVARQIYVFSRAARARVPKAEGAVELGVAFLRNRALLPDGGYAMRFGLDNTPIDFTRDLYDHAFVLLALSSAASVLGRDAVRRQAHDLLSYILAKFRHPAGGFEESLPPSRPRRQNPHMHFFEACLSAFDAFADAEYLDAAVGLADLLLHRLFQRAEGALPEFFDENLQPVREGASFRVEPGHHFEWIWLLDWRRQAMARAGRAIDSCAARTCEALEAFADRFGLDAATGLAVDGLSSDGSILNKGFRLWPQTERIKASARSPRDPKARTLAALNGFRRFLVGAPDGLWHERLDDMGAPVEGPAPATSLYHITCALTDDAVHGLTTRKVR